MTLKLNGSTAGSVSIDAPADTSPTGTDVTLTLPTSAGSSGQYLQTDGSGTLSWQTVSVTPDAITEGNTTAEVVDTGSDGHFKVTTEGTERLRINSQGNLGLGVTPSTSNVEGGQLEVNFAGSGIVATSGADTSFVNNSYFNSGWKYGGSNPAARLQLSDGNFLFYNAASGTANNSITFTERMRISSGGYVEMGQVGNPSGPINSTGFRFMEGQGFWWSTTGANSYWNVNTTTYFNFRYNGSGSGAIVIGNGSTSYNTSSDYRIKENVVDLDGAITRLKQLEPKRFNFIATPERTVDGFLAHEVQTVVPEAITGIKDQVEVWTADDKLPDGVSVGDDKLDEDGNTIPVYQGIDQAKLVPLLTAALQEAIGKIEALETANASLEARLTALEGGAA
jgi:hypothetical protein